MMNAKWSLAFSSSPFLKDFHSAIFKIVRQSSCSANLNLGPSLQLSDSDVDGARCLRPCFGSSSFATYKEGTLGTGKTFCSHLLVGASSRRYSSLSSSHTAWVGGLPVAPPSLLCITRGLTSAAKKSGKEHADGPVAAYREIVVAGKYRKDLLQDIVVGALQCLRDELLATEKQTWFGSMFRRSLGGKVRAGTPPTALPPPPQLGGQPRGIYMHGGVGVGKTMMMDLFFEHTPIQRKKRVHFHPFMLDIHSRMHALVKEKGPGMDPVQEIAAQVFEEARLLCLDEVEVTDIADAIILRRLFNALWKKGLVLVATSNSPPQDLYKGGLNRHLFVPFVDLLLQHCQVFSLVSEASRDYRRGHAKLHELFVQPLGPEADAAMADVFKQLSGGLPAEPVTVPVMMGRQLSIPEAAGDVARCTFALLCRSALGAADYLALTKRFKALVLDGVPWMGDPLQESEARRFITLVDVMYESGTVFACSAARPVDDLFKHDAPSVSSSSSSASSDTHDRKHGHTHKHSHHGPAKTAEHGVKLHPTGREGVAVAAGAGAHVGGSSGNDGRQGEGKEGSNSASAAEVAAAGEGAAPPGPVPNLQVVGQGGSSGRSTLMVGDSEWSATGLPGASLAKLAGHMSFTQKASSRTISRLLEMQSKLHLNRCGEMGQRALRLVEDKEDVSVASN